ncbi:hypothetical protein PAXRUDRAFT_832613 [Paxillus rubicundulus Ve08.2h10]|uniref:Unplaced genomic scaffold scaffold_911, whole genome shotgun sequence n=1 Tax=Paxillus rubicundulus Ve08.2h10 TaxID=930991 RepID=A0A0D0D154_9AGAM|nr:hypothetical protein PAXRUDRAFT_832613 [Paxillus rubicundulus Ve08.2h10]
MSINIKPFKSITSDGMKTAPFNACPPMKQNNQQVHALPQENNEPAKKKSDLQNISLR